MTNRQRIEAVFAAVPLIFLQAGYAKWIMAVYAALASFQGRACECFPSLAQIALRADIDPSNVSKAVSLLKTAGWIEHQRRRRASSLYRVLPQKGLWAKLPIAVLQAHLSKRDILVYACLAVYQGSNSNSYPSRKEIAHRMQIKNLNSVSKSISKLKQAGWLGASQRGPKSNLYNLSFYAGRQDGSVNISDSRPVTSDQDKKGLQFQSDQDKKGLQFQSDQDKKGLQFQSDQDKKGLQFQSDQDKKGLQFQSDQDKKGLQFQSDQDKKGLQFQSDQKYSSNLTNSYLNKTSYKTSSSTESGKTNSTLELKPNSSDLTKIRKSNSPSLTKIRKSNSPSLTKIKAKNSHPAKSRPPSNLPKTKPQASLGYENINRSRYMNGNIYKPIETEKQSIERQIYQALQKSSVRAVLSGTVLPCFYNQIKNKIEAAIIREEHGCLYMESKLDLSLQKKLKHYLGRAVVFKNNTYSAGNKQSILDYLESSLFKNSHAYAREGILSAVIKETAGFLYVNSNKIMPHHANLLESILGNRVVFCKAQETAFANYK